MNLNESIEFLVKDGCKIRYSSFDEGEYMKYGGVKTGGDGISYDIIQHYVPFHDTFYNTYICKGDQYGMSFSDRRDSDKRRLASFYGEEGWEIVKD